MNPRAPATPVLGGGRTMTTTRRGRRKAGEQAAPPGVALTVTQAARACRVSREAIQRRIDAGAFPSAARSDDGAAWTVPVADREAAGLRPRLHLYKRVAAIRILFGMIFAIDAFLKWRPGFASSFLGQVTAAAQGQPAWLLPWFHFWAHLIALAPVPFAYLSAIIESMIALALVFGLARQVTYFAAAAYAFLFWAIPEGFGGPYKGGATDIGTGIIYVIMFLALYQLDTLADESPWSLDPAIERRFPDGEHCPSRPCASRAAAPAPRLKSRRMMPRPRPRATRPLGSSSLLEDDPARERQLQPGGGQLAPAASSPRRRARCCKMAAARAGPGPWHGSVIWPVRPRG